MQPAGNACANPFFLEAQVGQRFCLFHPPAAGVTPQGAVLYVHPFAEEMNRSRRMAVLQARAFAAAGIAVLQIDLYGCGDSSGDFADARWESWKDDLALAHAWLANETTLPVVLWGLRTGALLALDYARQASHPVSGFLLWQPVSNGKTWLTQFLRLRMAGQMLQSENPGQAGDNTREMRATLARGESLEVAGYELDPALAAAVDLLDAGALAPAGGSVIWLDTVSEEKREAAHGPAGPRPAGSTAAGPLSPASQRIIGQWQQRGVKVQSAAVPGPQFWSTPDITHSPALIAASLQALVVHPGTDHSVVLRTSPA